MMKKKLERKVKNFFSRFSRIDSIFFCQKFFKLLYWIVIFFVWILFSPCHRITITDQFFFLFILWNWQTNYMLLLLMMMMIMFQSIILNRWIEWTWIKLKTEKKLIDFYDDDGLYNGDSMKIETFNMDSRFDFQVFFLTFWITIIGKVNFEEKKNEIFFSNST